MNTKNNQRTRITRLLFHHAYLSLLSDLPNDKITVRALCEKAELNRSTFYLHYQEPNDILKEIEDEQLTACSTFLDMISKNPDGNSYEECAAYTLQLLRHIHANADIYTLLLIKNKDLHFRKRFQEATFRQIMDTFAIPPGLQHADLVYQYVVTGSMALMESWIAGGFTEKEETLTGVFFTLARGCLDAALKMT